MTGGLNTGFVAIGRNEGDRFKSCLASLMRAGDRVVYVDSGSRDDSVAHARGQGVLTIELANDHPFTAARARNAGFDALMAKWPDTAFVMFIDGDCELVDGFVGSALAAFSADADLGIVTGRCRERRPDASIYNRLCDLEWNGPVGKIDACGGIFMARVDAFRRVQGFNPEVIAAEDDEFCIRLRASGSSICRIATDMCLHDADMRNFGQWWRRAVRAGYAYGLVGDLHPGYFRAQRLRAWLWGLALPVIILAGALLTQGAALALLLFYPLSMLRTRAGLVRAGARPRHAILGAAFLTLSKFPNLQGMIEYRLKKAKGRRIGIVEYK